MVRPTRPRSPPPLRGHSPRQSHRARRSSRARSASRGFGWQAWGGHTDGATDNGTTTYSVLRGALLYSLPIGANFSELHHYYGDGRQSSSDYEVGGRYAVGARAAVGPP